VYEEEDLSDSRGCVYACFRTCVASCAHGGSCFRGSDDEEEEGEGEPFPLYNPGRARGAMSMSAGDLVHLMARFEGGSDGDEDEDGADGGRWGDGYGEGDGAEDGAEDGHSEDGYGGYDSDEGYY
jgi:hypothetical protein